MGLWAVLKRVFYRTECFKCNIDACNFCVPNEVSVRGISFSLCKEHKNTDIKEIREAADELLLEETEDSEAKE